MGSRSTKRVLVVSALAASALIAAACGLTVTGGPLQVGTEAGTDAPPGDSADEAKVVGEQECTAGRATCSGVCTDTTTDPANCGGCAKACAPGEACGDGGCALLCLSDTTLCSGECVSTKTDPRHCGGCGKPCDGATPVCLDGACSPDCGDGGATVCPATSSVPAYCASLMTDPKNCGACGKACKANEVCSAATCVEKCKDPAVVGDVFPLDMIGCAAKVDYDERDKTCVSGYHVCSAQEWVDRRTGAAPKFSYWTKDDLGVEGSDRNCSVGKPGKDYDSCNNPMRVCANYTDPLGNKCNFKDCGFKKRTPPLYFGGCNNNKTAGVLCCK